MRGILGIAVVGMEDVCMAFEQRQLFIFISVCCIGAGRRRADYSRCGFSRGRLPAPTMSKSYVCLSLHDR